MDSFFRAIIEFITDIFVAIAEFLGWTVDYDDLVTDAPATPEE